jgi:adhesin/invasin
MPRFRRVSSTMLVVAVLWLAPGVPAADAGEVPAPRFRAARAYGVPVIPLAVEIVDMTGDGLPDIVTASQDTVVSLLRNRGGRLFAPAMNVSVDGGYFLGDAVVADLDGDGFLDVAAASNHPGSGRGKVSVLINDDGQGFLPAVTYSLDQSTGFIAAGDVDGDGDRDLGVGVSNRQGVRRGVGVMINAGDGTFAPPVLYPAPSSSGPLALVDVDGDVALDVVVVDGIDDVLGVLLGDGLGGFGTETTYPADTFFPISLAVGDMNHDDAPDAVIGGIEGEGSLLLNQGDGTFERAPIDVDLGAGGVQTHVTIADLQGDGHPDIAATSSNGWVTPVFGQGDGAFRLGGRFGAGVGPEGVAAGDLDGDGRQDLVVIGNPGTVTPLYGSGDGRFLGYPVVTLADGGIFVSALAATDLSGDGLPDLAVGGGSGGIGAARGVPTLPPSLAISLNRGGGRFGPAEAYLLPSDPTGIATADFDGDGILDLGVSLGRNDDENVAVLLGRGGGAFDHPPALMSVPDFPADVQAGDFTEDGLADIGLAIQNSGMTTVEVKVLPGLGDGSFGPPVTTMVSSQEPVAMLAAHLDGDDTLDLVLLVHNTQGSDNAFVVSALGTGTGTFSTFQDYPVGEGLGSLETADLDGDQVVDAVATSPDTNATFPLLGVGDGSFVPQPQVRVGTRPQWLAVSDLNGDGAPDAAISDDVGILWSLPGLGDGSFGDPVAYAAVGGPVAAADLDADGAMDVAESAKNSLIVGLYFGLVR